MTKVFIKTWGCSLNKADSEFMAGLLREARFELVENDEEADIVLLNSCTVKGPSERSLFRELEKYKGSYKIVVVAGCVAQTEPEKLEGYPLVGTKQLHKIVEVVEEALNENAIYNLSLKENPSLSLPKLRKNPVIEILPICRGCLGECSYCQTRAARGKLVSYPIEEIKKQAEKALGEGVKEIWLTGQDCGCYGFDISTNLARLLEELVKLEGDFRIRVGMINPNHLLEIKDELIRAYQSEKVFKFLHLPVQSGNDEILKKMKRKYSAEDFLRLVREFRENFPELTLATDIILGFPGESEEQYWDTLNLIKRVEPAVLNISRFWPRPKTKAAEMGGQVERGESKRRSKVLTGIFSNIAKLQNERWLGWEGEILIDEKGKEKEEQSLYPLRSLYSYHEGEEEERQAEESRKKEDSKTIQLSQPEQRKTIPTWLGRNFAYKQVVVEGDFKRGEKVKVRVNKIGTFDLKGKVL